MTQINFVEVRLENLVLRKSKLDHQREACFKPFSRERAPGRQKSGLCKLLGDRATTFSDTTGDDVGYRSPADTDWIDADVTAPSGVLGGAACIRNVLWQVGENDRFRNAPFSAVKRHEGVAVPVDVLRR